MSSASDESRMAAIIRCVLHIDPDQLDDEQFFKAWGQVKYFTTLAYGVDWKGE